MIVPKNLHLINEDLRNVNPDGPNLTKEIREKIVVEARENILYLEWIIQNSKRNEFFIFKVNNNNDRYSTTVSRY